MLVMQEGDSLFGGLPIIHITYQQYIANPSAYHDPDVIVHISGFPTAGNMPADYVGYDSNLNMEDIGNIATKAIAKVEPSDTALYLHEVGTYFINKDGNSCKTDVQISVGGTITLGTNCHVVDGVANDINSNLSGISNQLINVVDDELTTWCASHAVNNGVIFGYFPSNVSGNPSSTSGFVQVFGHSSDYIIIIAYTIANGGKIYRRIKNVTWGSWETIIN